MEGGATDVVVIGAGLAGLSASIEAAKLLQNGGGGKVYLIEKEVRVGGNSAKASSGMNAVTRSKGDTKELFMKDTMESGKGRSKEHLVQKLVVRWKALVVWLQLTFVYALSKHLLCCSF